jgi:hypothetical protein
LLTFSTNPVVAGVGVITMSLVVIAVLINIAVLGRAVVSRRRDTRLRHRQEHNPAGVAAAANKAEALRRYLEETQKDRAAEQQADAARQLAEKTHNDRVAARQAEAARRLAEQTPADRAVELQAEAAPQLAEEAHTDLAAARRPRLMLLDEPPPRIRDQPWAAVRVRNAGDGPALNVVVWRRSGGNLYRSAGAEANGFSGAIHLAPGEVFKPGPSQTMRLVGKANGYLDPGRSVVGEDPSTDLIAYCSDQFGNRGRFNLRTADPPQVWERGTDAPPWAGAWDPRLSSAQRGVRVPTQQEQDVFELVAALRDVVALLDNVDRAEVDVPLSGRAGQRPRVLPRRNDVEPERSPAARASDG